MKKTLFLLIPIVFFAAIISSCRYSDRDFVAKAAEDSLFEIALGKLAIQDGSRKEVQEMGQRLEKDYGSFAHELRGLANHIGVALPQKMTRDHEEKIRKLAELPRQKFDRQFLEEVI